MDPKAGDWVIFDDGGFRLAQVKVVTQRPGWPGGESYDWYVLSLGKWESRGAMRNEIQAVLQTSPCHCQVRLA